MNTKCLLAILLITSCNIGTTIADTGSNLVKEGAEYADLATTQWLSGSESCKTDNNPALQVMQADQATFVLRQNKCVTFEAPFIYVLIGREQVLVVDTGANEAPEESPIYETVMSLIAETSDSASLDAKKILVIHSHSHGDHTKGDIQFDGKQNIEVVGTSHKALIRRLAFEDWPNQEASIDLGGRVVTLIPIPGHQDQSIAIYDDQTGWLMTGDTLYPGLIRVKDWDIFKASIARLLEFSNTHKVSLIMGAHIEMNTITKNIYPIGTTYQPNEPPLAFGVEHLQELHAGLKQSKSSKKLKFGEFTIEPLSWMEKKLIQMMTLNKD